VLRSAKGFEVNEETLAFDLINKVETGGDYLVEKHTRAHLRRDYWYPPLTDRSPYETWVGKGAKDFRACALERARQLIGEHKPVPLASDISERLDEILVGARKEAGL